MLNQSTSQTEIKVGLEIHRQLDTKGKLFCACPTHLTETEPKAKMIRRLRPTQSELGEIDQAALFEFQRGRRIQYEYDYETTCLVEMDEEPPAPLNPQALQVALTVALMLGSEPADEIQVMRKVVIDGSNTGGFQRTCLVALGGSIESEGKKIAIQQISLEEDAARKVTEDQQTVTYSLDRLGTPLIEIATAPVLKAPIEVEKAALALGTILKATGKVKRGLGSIRQDLNISITGGALIEIKGVQKLELLSKVVQFEVQRQIELLKIRDELRERSINKESISREHFDVTDLFKETKSRILKEAIMRGESVTAVRLPGFKGLLGRELTPNLRLGTEMSSYASSVSGVKGIFHSDELPAGGITQEDVENLRKRLKIESNDSFVLVADQRERALEALNAVVARTVTATRGVPDETRMAMPDGTTRYMRPRPGAARMYPETDIPPTVVTSELLQKLKDNLPERPEFALKRLMEKFNINKKLAEQLTDSEYLELFQTITATSKLSPSFTATILTETLKSLERENLPVESIPHDQIAKIFRLVDEGLIAKEAMVGLLRWQSKNLTSDPAIGVKELGLRMLAETELEAIVQGHIQKNRELITSRGEEAFTILMRSVMSQLRGAADAQKVSQILKAQLTKTIAQQKPQT